MKEKDSLFDWKHLRLWRISNLAETLSIIVFLIYVLLGFWQISRYNQLAHTQFNTDLLGLFAQNHVYILDVLAQMASTMLQGAVYYLVLKGTALGLDMIVETSINYGENNIEEGAE